jgi:hypothetical protein
MNVTKAFGWYCLINLRRVDQSIRSIKLSGLQLSLCHLKKTSSREKHKTVFNVLTQFNETKTSLCGFLHHVLHEDHFWIEGPVFLAQRSTSLNKHAFYLPERSMFFRVKNRFLFT